MNKKTLKLIFLFSLIFLVFLWFSCSCLAQRELEIEYPEILGEKPETVETGLPEYVKYIFNFAMLIVGLVTLSALIWGGIHYLSSAGDPSKLKTAKEQIFAAILGLVILLSSYLILASINPQLLIFEFPSLTPIISPEGEPSPQMEIENVALIVEELPLSQSVKNGVWEEEQTRTIENLITDFKNFLNQEMEVDDSELEDDSFSRISDLNKYLKTLTDKCLCENLRCLCSKPENGCPPIGCSGDPCQTDQDNGVESDSPRGKMNEVLEIDRAKMEVLLGYQKEIIKQKNILREELRKFQEIEGGVIACQNQNKELTTLNEYLSTKHFFEERGDQVVKIDSYLEPKGDGLTFYCSSGGTIFDYAYTPEKTEVSPEEIILPEVSAGIEKISCPFVFPTGKVLDEFRELAIIAIFKLQGVSLLIEEMVADIQEMAELVSECNEEECEASCICIPNPCYLACAPPNPCTPKCKSMCIQCMGGCQGNTCPRAEITEKSKQIKETEDKIFETIEEIKQIFPRVSFLLKDKENPSNLNNLNTSIGLCYSSDIYNPTWSLLSCDEARGNYGPTDQLIKNCHPRNFFCCTLSEAAKLPLPAPIEKAPVYIIPAEKFEPLEPDLENCPQGWLCKDDVKYYNQYQDASEPLKQLLSCMRKRLDRIQEQKGLENTIGKIFSISDSKLYEGTCDWEAGPEEQGGCSHLFEAKRISAHYGGTNCGYQHKSYAIDIDVSEDFQKKYVDEIIEAAKECFAGAYVLDKVTHIHIGIGGVYHCGCTDF